uniref:Uncharacterized protein n=1 Tax=Strigamia maritima TaxID=126957 RepID=T1INV4_STRMM
MRQISAFTVSLRNVWNFNGYLIRYLRSETSIIYQNSQKGIPHFSDFNVTCAFWKYLLDPAQCAASYSHSLRFLVRDFCYYETLFHPNVSLVPRKKELKMRLDVSENEAVRGEITVHRVLCFIMKNEKGF